MKEQWGTPGGSLRREDCTCEWVVVGGWPHAVPDEDCPVDHQALAEVPLTLPPTDPEEWYSKHPRPSREGR